MTIKEIAKDLHLSISTVSKALNGAFDVSKETKEQVLKYAKAHGYKSRDERLTAKKVRRLAFIYDNIESQSNIIMPLSIAFSKHARESNFEVIQAPVSDIRSYAEFMKKNSFDGAFIAGLNYKSDLSVQLKTTTIPTVLYDNDLYGDHIATITNENINSVSRLTEHLIKNGHKKIGFIQADKNSFVANERFAGYIIGLSKNGIDYHPEYVYFGSFTEEAGKQAANYFISTGVTAVVTSADIIALGLIRELNRLGKRVPEDVAVTGYDDLDIARYMNPPITTVRQDLDLIGERAFNLLLSLMMNRTPQRVVVEGEIIIRGSSEKKI